MGDSVVLCGGIPWAVLCDEVIVEWNASAGEVNGAPGVVLEGFDFVATVARL